MTNIYVFFFFLIFLLMENLGAIADSRYAGFREITDRDVLELHCILHTIGRHSSVSKDAICLVVMEI